MQSKLLFVALPVLLALAVLVFAVKQKAAPERHTAAEQARPVRVIDVPSVSLLPRILGYGSASPDKVWQAVAEVQGRIVEIHPQLKYGAILGAGTQLLRIDDSDYKLVVTQIEADIRSAEALLAELDVQERNARASLKIDQRSLDLAEKELKRKRDLVGRNLVSQTDVDQEERNVLAMRQSAQSQRNTLNLIPAQRQVQQAQLALNQAKLEAAKLDLTRTVIEAPFDIRISEESIERSQFVGQGQVLLKADSISASEVAAQVPIDKLIQIVRLAGPGERLDFSKLMKKLPELLGLQAVVRLRSGGFAAEWEARFERMSDTIDPQTRTVGVVVVVDEPYRKGIPGKRPPLVKNMYVEVELRGKPKPEMPVVPRAAVHDGQVYVVDEDSRLRKKPVRVGYAQSNLALIEAGLAAGDRIVISDLVPAVEGMLLTPVRDEVAEQTLMAEAAGGGAIK